MNTAKKTIMIIGAAQEHCLGIKAAQDIGLKVFVTDGNKESPGFFRADAFSVASTYDPEATLKAARDFISRGGRIDGVMTLASDVPYTVAYVAKNLGLPGIEIDSALKASEKIAMKKCFLEKQIPMPKFLEASEKDLSIAEKIIGLPLVIKPVDSRGARGVQLLTRSSQLLPAYQVACNYSPAKRVMVEEYLPGPQLSVEGFMLDGEAHIPAVFDRNYEFLERFAPYIVENGGEMPSIYAAEYGSEIRELMKKAAGALGIQNGIVKGDLVIHNGRVKIIELAARLSGGFFGTVATPVSCGVDLVKANINFCLGHKPSPQDLEHKHNKAAAIRFAFPDAGLVKRLRGLEQVRQDPCCRYAQVFIKEGEIIRPISNHPARPAVVVAEGSSLKQAASNAKRLVNMLKWEIEPAYFV